MRQFFLRLSAILFWSVIAAAFIGPGTLVTAASAGSAYGLHLSWAIIFAIIACFVFQEMSARITIVSGKDLARLLAESRYKWWLAFIPFGVILGCGAYEAGNLLGAVIGWNILFPGSGKFWLLLIIIIAAAFLYFGRLQRVVTWLGLLVALMGFAFFYVAVLDFTSFSESSPTLAPTFPANAEWIVLGLIGTTIVPYNIFLASGLGHGARLPVMRFGLGISVIFGGLITFAVMVTGTNIPDGALESLASTAGNQLGTWGEGFIGIGILTAGLTSAVTAPLAAAIILSIFMGGKNGIDHRNPVYRSTWIGVLLFGGLFGFLEIQPVPVIIAAQALNGLALPLLGMALIVFANHRRLLGKEVNSWRLNFLCMILLDIVGMIGMNNLVKTIIGHSPSLWVLELLVVPFLAGTLWLVGKVRK